METMTIIWMILGFISIVALIYTFTIGINIIWGSCIVGIFIALVIALKIYFDGMGFDWLILLKGAITGSVAGIIFSFFKRN